jgi:hypothetical protein
MKIFLSSILFFSSVSTLAHPGGHSGPPQIVQCPDTGCTENLIREAIIKITPMVASSGQVNPTWGEVKTVKTIERVTDDRTQYWLAILENPKATEKSNSLLHFLITNEGFLADFNFDRPNVKTLETDKGSDSKMFAIGLLVLLAVVTSGGFLVFKKLKNKSASTT